jgi:quinol monooxygenase YgiN
MRICRQLVELRLQIKALPVHAAEMIQALRSIMLSARSERGYVSSRIYQEVDKPEALYYVEEWASPEQMEEQIISRRLGRLLALMETAPRPPVLEIRSISEARGLDYIGSIRLGNGTDAKPAGEGA